jgi:hypothetical protein
LTFELFLGFFQLFRFFFETLPLRVCVYSQGLDIYRKHIQQIYIFIYSRDILPVWHFFSSIFFFLFLYCLCEFVCRLWIWRICVSMAWIKREWGES